MDQRAQVVLVGQPQRTVVLVRPRHRQLQRPPGIEARCPRVGIHRVRGPGRRIVDGGPFGLEETKLAHYRSPCICTAFMHPFCTCSPFPVHNSVNCEPRRNEQTCRMLPSLLPSFEVITLSPLGTRAAADTLNAFPFLAGQDTAHHPRLTPGQACCSCATVNSLGSRARADMTISVLKPRGPGRRRRVRQIPDRRISGRTEQS